MNDSDMQNHSAPIVNHFFNRRMLARLGYTTPLDELSDFEFACFRVIENEMNRLEAKQWKKQGSFK